MYGFVVSCVVQRGTTLVHVVDKQHLVPSSHTTTPPSPFAKVVYVDTEGWEGGSVYRWCWRIGDRVVRLAKRFDTSEQTTLPIHYK